VELLDSILQSSPEKVSILTLGPLTNLAELLQDTPSAAKNIEMVYIMGGAVHVAGNLGSDVKNNQAAEWNIYVDPLAAKIVFESGVPITLVPLDATNQAPVTAEFYRQLQASHLTPEAAWILDLFTLEQGFFQSGGMYFWDPLTAAILSEPSLATYEPEEVCVIEEEGPQSGQTKATAGCPNIRVAVIVESARFEQLFLDTLNHP
jgi:pyrimidine-specific ribonucleoside hydrolase